MSSGDDLIHCGRFIAYNSNASAWPHIIRDGRKELTLDLESGYIKVAWVIACIPSSSSLVLFLLLGTLTQVSMLAKEPRNQTWKSVDADDTKHNKPSRRNTVVPHRRQVVGQGGTEADTQQNEQPCR